MLPEMCRQASYLKYSAGGGLPGEDFQVAGDGFDAAIEVRQVELLVGGVQVVVGESEAHHDAGDAEVAVEDADDGDGTAAAYVDRLLAELLLEGLGRGVDIGIVGVGERGRAARDHLQP